MQPISVAAPFPPPDAVAAWPKLPAGGALEKMGRTHTQHRAMGFGGLDAGLGPDHGREARIAKSGKDPMQQKAIGLGGADAGLRAGHAQRARIAKSGQDPMHQKAARIDDADSRLGTVHAPRARIAKSRQEPYAPESGGGWRRGCQAGAWPWAGGVERDLPTQTYEPWRGEG